VTWANRAGKCTNTFPRNQSCLTRGLATPHRMIAMKYYTSTTKFNCGIDLHARQMYVCVMDREGRKLVHTNIRNNDFNYFLKRVPQRPAQSIQPPDQQGVTCLQLLETRIEAGPGRLRPTDLVCMQIGLGDPRVFQGIKLEPQF